MGLAASAANGGGSGANARPEALQVPAGVHGWTSGSGAVAAAGGCRAGLGQQRGG